MNLPPSGQGAAEQPLGGHHRVEPESGAAEREPVEGRPVHVRGQQPGGGRRKQPRPSGHQV